MQSLKAHEPDFSYRKSLEIQGDPDFIRYCYRLLQVNLETRGLGSTALADSRGYGAVTIYQNQEALEAEDGD